MKIVLLVFLFLCHFSHSGGDIQKNNAESYVSDYFFIQIVVNQGEQKKLAACRCYNQRDSSSLRRYLQINSLCFSCPSWDLDINCSAGQLQYQSPFFWPLSKNKT